MCVERGIGGVVKKCCHSSTRQTVLYCLYACSHGAIGIEERQ